MDFLKSSSDLDLQEPAFVIYRVGTGLFEVWYFIEQSGQEKVTGVVKNLLSFGVRPYYPAILMAAVITYTRFRKRETGFWGYEVLKKVTVISWLRRFITEANVALKT